MLANIGQRCLTGLNAIIDDGKSTAAVGGAAVGGGGAAVGVAVAQDPNSMLAIRSSAASTKDFLGLITSSLAII
jgi:hypothetical protein